MTGSEDAPTRRHEPTGPRQSAKKNGKSLAGGGNFFGRDRSRTEHSHTGIRYISTTTSAEEAALNES